MQQIKNIFKKEFRDYFVSPIAYIVISIFLLVTGWFFFMTFFLQNQADLRSFFSLLPFTFSFIVPAITMKLFSEELSIGTYELLYTMPVTLKDIVLGKFLAGVAFLLAIILPTLSYPLMISFMGQLDWGPVIGGYIGAILLGSTFTAVGLFASTLTKNQIIAFIVGMVICFSLTLIDKMLFFFPEAAVKVVGFIGADFHFQNISKGIVDSRDILYFASVIFIALSSSVLAMTENK